MVELITLNVSIILLIFILTYIGIIHNRIDKTLAAILGAIISTIVIIYLKIDDPKNPGTPATEESLIHFEDLKIIGLIVGTLLLVEVSQDAGVFHFISVKILQMSKGNPTKLLRYFGALTMVLSALVNNISAMMIVGSLTLIACERLDLDPKPYIVTELSMTTVGGVVTLISSVPNIIIVETFASTFEISFLTFFLIGAPFAFFAMVINFAIFEYIFRNDIPKDIDPKINEDKVNEFDPWGAVKDINLFYRSITVLLLTILAFVFSQQLGLSLAVIALSGGVLMVTVSGKKFDTIMSKLDWGLIVFFLGLFILIAALDIVKVLDFIAEELIKILPDNSLLAAFIILWFVAFISGIVDNIVVAAVFSPILVQVVLNSGLSPGLLAWAAIFGAAFGGGFTPIGAPSAVVGLSLLYKKTGIKIGWGEFIKSQGIATIVRLIFTSIYLWILSLFLF